VGSNMPLASRSISIYILEYIINADRCTRALHELIDPDNPDRNLGNKHVYRFT
jgi:hypothetical protein